MGEEWRDIVGYEGYYQVSNKGRVKSLDRYIDRGAGQTLLKGIIRKPTPDKDGYIRISLWGKKRGMGRVHRLVAHAFISNPKNKPQINHKNGIKDDNRIENLEWATLSENRQHAYDTGLQNGKGVQGEKCNFSKLNKYQVLTIKTLLGSGFSNIHIAKEMGVTPSNISYIKNGKTWKHLDAC